ncbi:MAG: hypothetical protein EA378_00420 [Phycisphaerales bacterium]|nr:MAG: hypothetical protein EA378_00420 [Phycisphaerales bacterium]
MPMMRAADRRPSDRAAMMEALESRVLLSVAAPDAPVPFVYVGLEPAATRPVVVYTEGVVGSETGVVTGNRFGEGFVSPAALGVSEYERFRNIGTGSFEIEYRDGIGFDNLFSAEFQNERGFAAGWASAFNDGFGYAAGLIVERPEAATLDALQGNWQYFLYRIPVAGSTGFAYAGTLSFGGGFASQVLTNTGGGGIAIIRSIEITETGSNGVFTDNTGNRWYVSADGATLITVDATTNDGFVSIGMAIRASPDATTDDLSSIYRMTEIRGAGLTTAPLLSSTTFRLNANGTADFLDTEDLDDGTVTVLRSGTWASSGGNVELFDTDGTRTAFTSSVGSTALAINNIRGPISSGATISLFGLAVQMPDPFPAGTDPLAVQLATGELTTGRPLVYELRADNNWYVTDLLAETGSDLLPGSITQIEVFNDPVTGRVTAVVNVAGDNVTLFNRDPASGDWSEQRVVPVNQAADPITGNVQIVTRAGQDGVFGSADDRVWLVGLRADGALVAYVQTGEINADGEGVWRFENITGTQLTAFGRTMPQLAGPIQAFVTPWDGIHVVGVDAGGNIQSLWFAPGLVNGWRVDNLSVIAGTPFMQASSLEVWVQPYGGINIIGTTAANQPVVTWWTPGFGPNWESDNMFDIVPEDAQTLAGQSIVTLVDSTGSVAFVAFRPGSVELFAYRWDRTTDTWTAGAIDVESPDEAAVAIAALRSGVGSNDAFYLFANAGDDGYAVYTLPRGSDVWRLDSLSTIAVPS